LQLSRDIFIIEHGEAFGFLCESGATIEFRADALQGVMIGAGFSKVAGGEAAHDRKEK
jgi:hypothetical protein